jgi:hypothetical protein
MKHFVYSLVVAFLILAVGQAANAQCVGCTPGDTGFDCTPQPSGGKTCRTSNDGRTCTVSGLCSKKPIVEFADYFYRPTHFSNSTILGVAALHPRLAETLINLQGRTLAELDSGKMFWMPGEVYYKDIEQLLNPDSDKEALAKVLQMRDKSALERGYKPISYGFIIEKPPNGRSVTLRIQRTDSVPSLHDAYSSLEISVDVTSAASLNDNGVWRLR